MSASEDVETSFWSRLNLIKTTAVIGSGVIMLLIVATIGVVIVQSLMVQKEKQEKEAQQGSFDRSSGTFRISLFADSVPASGGEDQEGVVITLPQATVDAPDTGAVDDSSPNLKTSLGFDQQEGTKSGSVSPGEQVLLWARAGREERRSLYGKTTYTYGGGFPEAEIIPYPEFKNWLEEFLYGWSCMWGAQGTRVNLRVLSNGSHQDGYVCFSKRSGRVVGNEFRQ